MSFLRWNRLELAAVVSSLLYTILFSYGIIWCWFFATLSALFFGLLCFQKKIYAELILQLFYLAMAVYGFINWGDSLQTKPPLALSVHGLIIAANLLLIGSSGLILKKFSDSRLPFLDSFTTISSISATLLMVNFYEENWLYFIVINTVSIFLYYKRGLKLGALLFVLYSLLSLNGYLVWTNWW